MAKRIIKADVPDNNLIAEIEMEDTIPVKTILAKLRMGGHLDPEDTYFIKTPEGDTIREDDPLRLHRKDQFVITKDKDWKPISAQEILEENVERLSGENMIDDDNWIWSMPILGEASWTDLNLRTQLFDVDPIVTPADKKFACKIIVQNSIIDSALASRQGILDAVIKMKQILSETIQLEFRTGNLDEKNFAGKKNALIEKMQGYITAHMELKWGTRINYVSIAAYKYE